MKAPSRRRSRRPRLRDRDGKPLKARPPLTEAVTAGPEILFQKLAGALAGHKVDRPDIGEALRLLTERPSFPHVLQAYPALRAEEAPPAPPEPARPRPRYLADAYCLIAKTADPTTCSLSGAKSEAENIMGRSFEDSSHRKAQRKAGWPPRS
jgi:hypothetical protein